MTLYEELQARGLIAQVTDEALISDLINNGRKADIDEALSGEDR